MGKSYFRLLRAVRPHLGILAVAVAAMLLLSAMTGLVGYVMGPVFSFVFSGGARGGEQFARVIPHLGRMHLSRPALLALLPAALVAIGVLRGVGYFGQFFSMGLLGQRVVADLRARLHRKLLLLPPAFYARASSGDLLARFASDIAGVEFAVTYGLAAYLRDGMQVLVLLGVSFAIDWRLALLGGVVIPGMILPVVRFARRLKRVAAAGQEQIGRLYSALHEAIAGVLAVQAFGAERHEEERFARENEAFLQLMRRSFAIRAAFTPTLEILAAVGVALTVRYAAVAVDHGTLDPSRVVSFLATAVLLYNPLKSLGNNGQSVTTGTACAERVFELLDAPVPIADRPGAAPLPRFSRAITFEAVSFRYPPREDGHPGELALREVSLEIGKGEVVALVGPSGAGKSTLALLIPRFQDPTLGRVLIDGIDLRQVRLATLRAQVAVVAQETFLFNGSIRANIAYGRPDVSLERIRDCARAARAAEFIEQLPAGYDTVVGERGATLSGGQKQRLAIARALLKDAPILILDEATSALDTENEREVQSAIEALMAERTTLVIAHRLSTIRSADRIAVLDAGRLVEEGRHEALYARGGAYRRLCDLQFAGSGSGPAERARLA